MKILTDLAYPMDGPDTAYVQPNFEILVPHSASWAVRWELGQFAVLGQQDQMLKYRLDKTYLMNALKRGLPAGDVLNLLTKLSPYPFLADDMGLGKTLQAIALILSVLEEQDTVKTLVVVPTSLIDNWMSELNRFAPSLKCVAVTGVAEKRNEIFDSWQNYHVFITSYGLVVNDIKAYEKKVFDILILDEAQKFKPQV